MNEIILNKNGNTWVGFWSKDKDIDKQIDQIHQSILTSRNKFFVIEKNGTIRAAQATLTGALRYMDNNKILVHI
jgi:hypothetical protein